MTNTRKKTTQIHYDSHKYVFNATRNVLTIKSLSISAFKLIILIKITIIVIDYFASIHLHQTEQTLPTAIFVIAHLEYKSISNHKVSIIIIIILH